MTIKNLIGPALLLLIFTACKKSNTPDQDPNSKSGTLYYVGCQGAYSFDLSTGNFNWKKGLSVGGTSGTPYYDNGLIYLADPYGVACLNASDGGTKWQLPYSDLNGFYSGSFAAHVSPVLVDSILYTVGFEGTNFKVDLYAIHKTKGTVLWQNLLYGQSENLSQPSIINNKLIIVKIDEIVGYDRNSGQPLWHIRYDSVSINPAFNPQKDNDLFYVYDNAQNKIVVIDPSTGHITRWISLPADFDGNSFAVNGQQILGVSKTDETSVSCTTYTLDKSTGSIIGSSKVMDKNPYAFPFWDQTGNHNFLFDLTTDESVCYLYNPIYAMAYDQATSGQKWKVDLPLKKITDSTNGSGSMVSSQPLVTNSSLVFLSSYQYIDIANPGTVKNWYYVDVIDKNTGKPIKSLPLSNLECTGIPYYYMIVQSGHGYYSRIDAH